MVYYMFIDMVYYTINTEQSELVKTFFCFLCLKRCNQYNIYATTKNKNGH